jgi:WD40 repeat protein
MEQSPLQQPLSGYKRRSRWIVAALCLFCVVACLLIWIIVPDDRPLQSLPFGAHALSFDRSGKLLLAVHDGIIDVRDLEKDKQIALVHDKADQITMLALDANREVAYCGTAKGHLRPLDLKTFQPSDGISMGSSRTLALAISPKSRMIAAAFSGDPAWKVVFGDLPAGRVIYERDFRGGKSITFSDDEHLLAFCGSDRRGKPGFHVVKLPWPKDNEMDFIPFKGEEVFGVLAFVASTHIIAVAQSDVIWLWDCNSKKELATLRIDMGQEFFTCLACTRDGKTLIAGSGICLYLCQVSPLRLIRRITVYEKADIDRLAVSDDGAYLAASCADIGFDDRPGYGETKVWRLDKLLGK